MVRGVSTTRDIKEDDYLSPSFDPNRLTKPQLRSLLAENGVTDLPPTAAKKEELVEIFLTNITRRSHEIKKRKGEVKPSDVGIEYLDRRSNPSPRRSPSARRKSRATSSRRSREESTLVSPSGSPVGRAKSRTRGRSKRRAVSKVRTESSPVSRNILRSESPLAVLQNTLPKYSDSPKTATLKLHDRLDYIANANRLMSAAKIIEQSPKHIKETHHHKTVKTPQTKISFPFEAIKTISVRLGSVLYFISVLVLAIAVGLYIRFKFFYHLPYCDNSASLSKYLPKTMHLSLFESLSEMCIPCPIHGKCSTGNLQCNEGFIEHSNWIAFGHDCVPDRRKLTLVEDLSGRIRMFLAERAGKAFCGEIEELERVVSDKTLATMIREKYPGAEWNTAQFDSYYRLALDDLAKNHLAMGIDVSHNPLDGALLLQSKNPRIPVGCRIRIMLNEFYAAYRFRIWLVIFTLLAILYGSARFHHSSNIARKVEELVQAVLQILAEQDALNRRDPTIPSTISIHQIRDALFFKTPNKKRNRLWPVVCQAIERNSNVRESVMSLKGEQHRVWEWIGSDVLSPFMQRS